MTDQLSGGADERASIRTDALVRQWCASARVTRPFPDLSDEAALLIASAWMDPESRQTIVRRVTDRLPLPGLGGYRALRATSLELAALHAELDDSDLSKAARAIYQHRVNFLQRKLDQMRLTVVASNSGFANSFRTVRRERRDGVHLDLDRRERLFVALQYTPVSNIPSGTILNRFRASAVDTVSRNIHSVWQSASSPAPRAREVVTDLITNVWELRKTSGNNAASPTTQTDSSPDTAKGGTRKDGEHDFADAYETLMFIAGALYDEIAHSRAWFSEHFSTQRFQLNIHDELAQIAVDLSALRAIRYEIDQTSSRVADSSGAGENLRHRAAELGPVWEQLLCRVEALARITDIVGDAERQLVEMEQWEHSLHLERRIDDLVARSGSREMSTDNAQRVAEQLSAGREQLESFRRVLGGNIAEMREFRRLRP